MDNTPVKFSKLPLISVQLTLKGDTAPRERFISEWRRDKTVYVRSFRRDVRAGGCNSPVVVVVVRRRPQTVAPTAAQDGQ